MKELNDFLLSSRENIGDAKLPSVNDNWRAGDLKSRLEVWNGRINRVRAPWQGRHGLTRRRYSHQPCRAASPLLHLHKKRRQNLSVISSGSFNRRGSQQLISFSSRALGESRLAPQVLHISIEATNQAWMDALTFMPHLEEFVIGSARPSSLRSKVLQSLIARPVHTNNLSIISATGEWRAPLCPLLRRFGLKYYCWLRTSEHFDLIPDFASIILSRMRSNCSLQCFWVWMR